MQGRARPLWPLAVAGIAALVYAGSLRHGFALDDVLIVRDSPAIRSLAGIPRLFVRPYWDFGGDRLAVYRPLTLASFAIQRVVLGPGPFAYHLANVVLHAGASALAWYAARRASTH